MKSSLQTPHAIPAYSLDNTYQMFQSFDRLLFRSHMIQAFVLIWLLLCSLSLSAQTRGKIISAEVFTKQTVTQGCDSNVKVITFTAYVTADGPCEASYRWSRNDGGLGSIQSLTFKEAGTQVITTTWSLWLPAYVGWEKVTFSKPNVLSSNQANFEIYCCQKETAPNCKTNPFTINPCALDLLGSFKNLVKDIGTRICNARVGYITVSSAMNASCYTPGANLSGIATYSSFYAPRDSAFRVSWSADNLGYDYYGACRPEPIVWPKGMGENHVYSALLIPVDAYKVSPHKGTYELLKEDAIRPTDIADLLGSYIEPASGYIGTTESINYNNRYSSKGIVVKVRLKTGEEVLCYVLNNYDTAGTMYWKDPCVGEDGGVITKITTQPRLDATETQVLYPSSPNPFTTETEIRMNIPATAKQAVLAVYNQEGVAVKQIGIADRGAVGVKLSAQGLKAGIYVCSLHVDGKAYTQKIVVAP